MTCEKESQPQMACHQQRTRNIGEKLGKPLEKGATNGRTKKRKAKRKRVFNVRIAQSQFPRSSLKSGDEGGKRKPEWKHS